MLVVELSVNVIDTRIFGISNIEPSKVLTIVGKNWILDIPCSILDIQKFLTLTTLYRECNDQSDRLTPKYLQRIRK